MDILFPQPIVDHNAWLHFPTIGKILRAAKVTGFTEKRPPICLYRGSNGHPDNY